MKEILAMYNNLYLVTGGYIEDESANSLYGNRNRNKRIRFSQIKKPN